MKKLFLLTLFSLFALNSLANKPEPLYRDFQIAFISPISTNGMDSWNTCNSYSVNLLGGHSYGTEVFEFGGLYNINHNHLSGFQFAGLFNLNGKLKGASQIAGLFNMSGGGSSYFQFAGLFNIAVYYEKFKIDGAQISGIANVATKVKGAQLSGIANVGTKIDGAQLSGITSVATKVDGAQLSGITSIATKVDGAQLSGITNVATKAKGAQIAGITNYVERGKGVQLSGIFNYSERMDGSQFALINYSEKITGCQFGLINISEECGGVPIGLINIVEDGKSELEIAFGDVLTTTASYRLGTDAFYTIFSVGANYTKSIVDYGAGLGIGTDISWRGGWGNQIEGYIYALTEQGEFQENINLMTQLRYTISVDLGCPELFFGPNASLTISDVQNTHPSTIQPWTQYNWQNGNTELKLSVGFSAGIRF